jgi:hypothetical protein
MVSIHWLGLSFVSPLCQWGFDIGSGGVLPGVVMGEVIDVQGVRRASPLEFELKVGAVKP